MRAATARDIFTSWLQTGGAAGQRDGGACDSVGGAVPQAGRAATLWSLIGGPRAVAGGATLLGLAVTVAIVAVPALRFAYPRPGLHIAIETTAALTALLATFLMVARVRRSGLVCDLMLSCALAVFAASHLVSGAAAAIAERDVSSSWIWIVTTTRLVAAGLLAAASLLPRRRVGGAAAVAVIAGVSLSVAALAGMGFTALAEVLPTEMRSTVAPTTAVLNLPGSFPMVLVQLVAMVLFAVAAVRFSGHAQRLADELLGWLSVAAVLAAVSSLNYLLYPSLYSKWVFTGDLFRLGSYVLILVGAAQEIRRYWLTAARAAVLEERRRIAREFHDGLAQELAYVATQSRRAARRGDEGGAQLAAAAERALDEARLALIALTRPLGESFERALAQSVETVASRAGSSVTCDIAPGVALPAAAHTEAIRIASEAVANAARHGRAGVIRVELSGGERPCLRICDDGIGFDPAALPDGAGVFGIASMHQRARSIGADFRLWSEPGSGTTVEVSWR